MSAHQGWKTASLMLCIAAATMAAPLLAQHDRPPAKGDDGPPVIAVKPAKLKGVVRQQGWLERAKIVEVACPVEGRSTIRSLVPHGTTVKAGDVVCELDRSPLEDALRNQEIATKSAEAAYQSAKLDRVVAEIALTEYTDGTAKQEQFGLEGAVTIARESIRVAQERLERIQGVHKRVRDAVEALGGAKSPADIVAELDIEDQLAFAKLRIRNEKLKLEQNQLKEDVFKKFTRGKAIKELEFSIEKAKTAEFARKQTWELEQLKERKRRSQITRTTIHAPIDGIVASWPQGTVSDVRSAIAEGATVREREVLLTLSSGPLVARVVLPAVLADRFAVGNTARILPVARPARFNTWNGVVAQIDTAPQGSGRRPAGGDQTCVVTVTLDKQPHLLVPGAQVFVEIAANERDNALVVPLEAVHRRADADYVAVLNPEGGIDWRQITLGAQTDTSVEIAQGVQSGESVLADATALPSSGGS